MRTTPTAAGAVLCVAMLLGACGTSERDAAEPTPAAATASASPTPAEPTAEPEPVVAPLGSPDNPATPGVDTVPLGAQGAPVYQVALSPADFAAGDVVTGYFDGNEPAPAGSSYVLLPVSATYVGTGAEPAHAWLDLGITFVAADGRTFEPSMALVPGDLSVTPELATGESAQGSVPFVVPDDALTGGTWRVENQYVGSGGETVHFTAV
ncbi:hypothetical protein J1G42_01935 [Cellulomonas sp. zg-ZUI222]|uniref:hypothetical protein n=1 Tax=Cellulomonas wangleii TaxID=2816956 RepID=UPI001A945400|nr:hypothetical protein [Cellulomonas wangleii]MBO0919582.1 hypothetical protein [Cellulomonas wangleii]